MKGHLEMKFTGAAETARSPRGEAGKTPPLGRRANATGEFSGTS